MSTPLNKSEYLRPGVRELRASLSTDDVPPRMASVGGIF